MTTIPHTEEVYTDCFIELVQALMDKNDEIDPNQELDDSDIQAIYKFLNNKFIAQKKTKSKLGMIYSTVCLNACPVVLEGCCISVKGVLA